MQMIENILAMVIYTDYAMTNWLFFADHIDH